MPVVVSWRNIALFANYPFEIKDFIFYSLRAWANSRRQKTRALFRCFSAGPASVKALALEMTRLGVECGRMRADVIYLAAGGICSRHYC
jgi:hypothetical protein